MRHHKLDTLYLMRLLVAIVRCGSFAAAAAQLGITPSKASKDLRHLEQSLGSVLLSRTTRRVQLTDAGELAYRQADQMIALHEQLLDGLQRRRSALCGELRITAPDLWGEVVLTPVPVSYTHLLLARTRLPVGEVASRCGYQNQGAFAERFLAETGLTPSLWRRQNGRLP